jgi:hypothetical protein
MVRRERLAAVPHGNISKANKLSAGRINSKNRMHENPTQKAAPANRTKSSLPHLRAAQNNLACILNGQNIPALNPFSGSVASRIAQETAKPNLPTPRPTAKFKNA